MKQDVLKLVSNQQIDGIVMCECPYCDTEEAESVIADNDYDLFLCKECGQSGNLNRLRDDLLDKNKKNDASVLYWVQKIFTSNPLDLTLSYFLKERGVSRETAELFGLGSIGGANTLSKLSSKNEELRIQLSSLGYVYINEGGNAFDKFRDRITFPIKNEYGIICGFAGRTTSDGKTPKYLNSDNSDVFRKSEILYGLHENLENIENDTAIVVEGYMDVIGMHSNGFKNAVATMGIALSEKQIKLLTDTASEQVFMFDGDSAGISAALNALLVTCSNHPTPNSSKFAFLPEGEDPDSLSSTNPTLMKEIIEQAMDISEVMALYLNQGRSKSELENAIWDNPNDKNIALLLRELNAGQEIAIKIENDLCTETVHMTVGNEENLNTIKAP